jgi:hypothetical protein
MWEVPNAQLRDWHKMQGVSPDHHVPKRIDVDCPNPACKRSVVNIALDWKMAPGFLHASTKCANCKYRAQYFLLNSPADLGSEAIRAVRVFQFPKPSVQGPFEDGIAEISPAFVEIHSQAQESEGLGLTTLVGIGYRKAVEFLIKDYLIKKLPDRADAISKATLAQCINNFVSDPRVRTCAERATWLGNDETHYVRIWLDRDLQDLKILIKLTQYWISSEVLTSRYGSSMTKPTSQ